MRTFLDTAMAGNGRRARLARFSSCHCSKRSTFLAVYIKNLGWAATNDVRPTWSRIDRHVFPHRSYPRRDDYCIFTMLCRLTFLIYGCGQALLSCVIPVVLIRNWLVSLSLGLFVAITVVILFRMVNFAVPSWEKERQASASLYGFLEERLSGTEDIRSNNAAPYVLDRFYRLTRDLMRKTLRAGLRWAVLANTTWTLFAVGNAIALVLALPVPKPISLVRFHDRLLLQYDQLLVSHNSFRIYRKRVPAWCVLWGSSRSKEKSLAKEIIYSLKSGILLRDHWGWLLRMSLLVMATALLPQHSTNLRKILHRPRCLS
jgi:hypothetical protein